VTRPRPARLVRSERSARTGIPEATVSRLPLYLQALTALAERGVATVSSEELAAAAGVGSAKLRKDLSHLGSYGTRGVGYDVEYLVYQISRELGLTQDWRVVIVGVGNLGQALAAYGGFTSRGFTVAALVDADPAVVGRSVAGLPVLPMGELERVVEGLGVQIGVVATPAAVAQEVTDRLVSAGITGVLNFAPCLLSVPDGVMVRRVDLSTELQILAFHEQRRVASDLAADLAPDANVTPMATGSVTASVKQAVAKVTQPVTTKVSGKGADPVTNGAAGDMLSDAMDQMDDGGRTATRRAGAAG
jgi:redox-sensing transcriptional repressor